MHSGVNMTRDKNIVSKTMRKVKSKDTSIEVKLRKALWKKGFRYRKNYVYLPGKPDIVLTKYKVAIFCDSEFFHGKDWDLLKQQLELGNNAQYWIKKIERNIERDKYNDRELTSLGWTVLHFWGKDIMKKTDDCVKVIEEIIFENYLNKSDDLFTDLDK